MKSEKYFTVCNYHQPPVRLWRGLCGTAVGKNRIQKLYAVSEEAAENMIAQSDKERALYHQTVTGQKWADARRYHISIDTSKIGLDQCVELILKYYCDPVFVYK